MLEPPVLVGSSIRLRPWKATDEDALIEGLADPGIERFTVEIPYPFRHRHARDWIADLAPAAWAAGGAEYAIEWLDGSPVGGIGIRRQGEVGVLGYWVALSARGHRLASQAVSLIAPWAAAALGLEQQELVHDLDNVASCRSAELADFRAVGILVGGGQNRDGTARDVERHVWSADEVVM